MSLEKICFIGAGNMSSCLLKGLHNIGFNMKNISVIDRNPEKLNPLKNSFSVNVYSQEKIQEISKKSEASIICVKPKDIKEVCLKLNNDKLIVSIAAGISTQKIEEYSQNKNIIRAMPNIAAEKLESGTTLFTVAASREQKTFAENLFSAVGKFTWLKEEAHIDITTALAGSSPAFFFLITEIMANTAVELGLDEETAYNLAKQSLLGAGKLAIENNLNNLIEKVCSKGGTTEKGLQYLKSGGIKDLIKNTIKSSYNRAIELNN